MADIISTSAGDEAQVRQLLDECSLPFQDLTAAHMDGFVSLYDGEQLVGCVGLEIFSENALLRSLAVEPGYRGQGLGARLLAAAEGRAASRGVHTLYLLTTTAEAFFTAHGYHTTERSSAPDDIQQTVEFQSLCPTSAICMVKKL